MGLNSTIGKNIEEIVYVWESYFEFKEKKILPLKHP
jgi:hypothetical protein